MTTGQSETAVEQFDGGGRFVGVLLLGIFATASAGVGIWWLGMTGYVWKDWTLWGSSSWSDEWESGTAVAVFFFAVWALFLIIGVVLALTGARRAQGSDRRALLTMSAVMPLVSIGLALLVAPILLGQGGAQLIPLEELV